MTKRMAGGYWANERFQPKSIGQKSGQRSVNCYCRRKLLPVVRKATSVLCGILKREWKLKGRHGAENWCVI